ncbi:MAG: DUF6261 family protein [bacterium]
MEIIKIDLAKLHNEEHFQFQTEFKTQVEVFTAISLNIEAKFDNYLLKYAEEDEALVFINKSTYTNQIAAADAKRDSIFNGLRETVKAARNHFTPAVVQAANNLMVIFDAHGNVAVKPYDEETAAITSLVADLQGDFAADVALVGVTAWVVELKASNISFELVVTNRYSEESAKTILRMKRVRKEIDKLYQEIVNLINAMILVNGDSHYKDFVTEMNHRIDNFKNVIAKRKGKN